MDPQTNAPCLSSSKNQIISRENDIEIYGGSIRYTDFNSNYPYKWNAESAYIMSDHNHVDDFGVIKILSSQTFFDKNALEDARQLRIARIVPICLGAENIYKRKDIRKKEVRGLGWGTIYELSLIHI